MIDPHIAQAHTLPCCVPSAKDIHRGFLGMALKMLSAPSEMPILWHIMKIYSAYGFLFQEII
jgi:hypothetical protein